MCVGAAGAAAMAATPIYITPDVPTTETATATTLLPWQIVRYATPGPTYTLVLTVPGDPHIDAIQKLDAPGGWLFSVEVPNNLAGNLAIDAEPRDVVRLLAGIYTLFFSGASQGIPLEVNLDALHTEEGDNGDIIVSFDVPVELPAGSGNWFEPADLLRFTRTGAPPFGWTFMLVGNPVFDASAAGTGGVEISYNTIGTDGDRNRPVLAMDVPARLDPSVGPLDYELGQLAQYNAVPNNFSLFEALIGWPTNSAIDGISCLANPGRVPLTIRLGKAAPPDIIIDWTASCSEGAEDYGIYQGVQSSWYTHTLLDCNDAGANTIEQVTPAVGSSYYLVVPWGEGGGLVRAVLCARGSGCRGLPIGRERATGGRGPMCFAARSHAVPVNGGCSLT